MTIRLAHDGYLADPFLFEAGGRFYLYGTPDPGRPEDTAIALVSDDLAHWTELGSVLEGVPGELGRDVWAPEVAAADGAYWMYYSVGRDIEGHHLRVARADRPEGPFRDLGLDLTPGESFAIDASPFLDADGAWWLFFARDVPDAERRGTHLAVAPLDGMTRLGEVSPVLAPDSPWQIFERDRDLYGRRADWWTLEGPTVVRRGQDLVLLFSGGSWEGPGYGVSSAVAGSPRGPWHHAPTRHPTVLSTAIAGLPGPGHCSVLTRDDGSTVIAFHAWNPEHTMRRPYLADLVWDGADPRLDLD
ncbi:glycoside hydrolase family 43 protein [Pseudolysinimonas sp.]|uniref:glycoside hydrolase family 43 protein n=1 Tax=Pseudolysinimonas sp. TaxID=2680009 RepID=UPI003F8047AA